MTQAIEDFFSGGVKAAKFEDRAYGTVIGGEIVEDPRMQQQRDYESGAPITYPDGNPAMQMVVIVQAQEATVDDDGRRAFYVRGQLREAVGEALRKQGARAPSRGGRLFVRYQEDKPVTLKNGRPGNPQKIYAAKYEAPAAGATYFDAPGAQSTTPTTEGAAAPGLLCPAGVDAGQWGQMNADQQAQLYHALGRLPAYAAAPSLASEIPF